MCKQFNPMTLLFLFSLYFLSPLNVNLAGAGDIPGGFSAEKNPFTPKASLIRYLNKEIRVDLTKSSFLISKASPLTAVDSAAFAKLASQNELSTRLPAFCSSAKLFCFPDLSQSLEKHDADVNFATYSQKNFTNYDGHRIGGVNSFQKYSVDENVIVDSFRRYSRNSFGHDDRFSEYATQGNVVDQGFNTYGTKAGGGESEFKNYHKEVNNPNSRFTSYSDSSNGRAQTFKGYSQDANAGNGQSFSNYAKNGNGVPNKFSSYSTDSNVVGSTFSGYGQSGNGISDNFTSYGVNGNVPQNNFNNYGAGGNGGEDSFSRYRDDANVGDDSFSSYEKNSNGGKAGFSTYGQSANIGTDTFTGYGPGGEIEFKTYGLNTTFKEYSKNAISVSFERYNITSASESASTKMMMGNSSLVKRWVEPGKFFREKMLKQGTIMPMPDIKDKMPERSFLPRTIVSKLPFSTSKINVLKQIFHAEDNSSMDTIISDALKECERAPSPGETKRCVGSAEDLIDFATSVLGRNILVRTSDNVRGSKQQIMIGSIKGINGGKITKSVSCHQSLYPYLLYYCHSVPKVRVYEADILDPTSKEKINHGVAICHLDTSQWSPGHGAFLALGSGPGRIEVCHWIFENDLTWTVAD
ncbi:polygalacturonase 1 beta-like protein 3 [Carica papaya]|uniref:polygalacturonase 1 beta-like protein 3 n=1 Tax=Carica papaya TaxID=3649 RepID=UPI000B8C81F2|nr:polygalacturonase 1 beta-like protein 3 [Carica papaya]